MAFLQSWWLEGRFHISSSHLALSKNMLRPFSKKSPEKSISYPFNIAFCFPNLSVFLFAWTLKLPSLISLSVCSPCLPLLSRLNAAVFAFPMLQRKRLPWKTKQMFSSDRCHTVRKHPSVQRNEYEYTCVLVPPWSVTACWGNAVRETEWI